MAFEVISPRLHSRQPLRFARARKAIDGCKLVHVFGGQLMGLTGFRNLVEGGPNALFPVGVGLGATGNGVAWELDQFGFRTFSTGNAGGAGSTAWITVGDSNGSGSVGAQTFSIFGRTSTFVTNQSHTIYGGPVGGIQLRYNAQNMELLKSNVASIGTSTGNYFASNVECDWLVTYDGTTVRFYINGVAAGTGSSSQTFTLNSQHWLQYAANGEGFTDGDRIRHIGICQGVLSANAAKRLMGDGFWTEVLEPGEDGVYVIPSGSTGRTLTFSLSSVVQQARSATASMNAAVLTSNTISTSLTAAVKQAKSVSTILTSAVQQARSATTSMNAAAQGSGAGANTSMMAAVQLARSAVSSLNTAVQGHSSAVAAMDSYVQAPHSVSTSINAMVQAGNSVALSLSAAVLRSASLSVGLDVSVLRVGSQTTSLSAALALARDASTAIDFAVQLAGQSVTSSMDAFVQAGFTSSAQLSAAIQALATANVSVQAAIQIAANVTLSLNAAVSVRRLEQVAMNAAVWHSRTLSLGMDGYVHAPSAGGDCPTAEDIAAAVWGTGGGPGGLPALQLLAELHKIHGLTPGVVLEVSETARTAGAGIVQAVDSSGATTTVTRT